MPGSKFKDRLKKYWEKEIGKSAKKLNLFLSSEGKKSLEELQDYLMKESAFSEIFSQSLDFVCKNKGMVFGQNKEKNETKPENVESLIDRKLLEALEAQGKEIVKMESFLSGEDKNEEKKPDLS